MDLSASDFELVEDGVRQKIDSFSRVFARRRDRCRRRLARAATVRHRRPDRSARAAPLTRLRKTGATTALVFDHLSAETLTLAQKATLAYVPLCGDSRVRVGVFACDLGMRAMQRYTNDRSAGAAGGRAARCRPAWEERNRRPNGTTTSASALAESDSANASAIAGRRVRRWRSPRAKRGDARRARDRAARSSRRKSNMLRSFETPIARRRGYGTSTVAAGGRPLAAGLPGPEDDRVLLGGASGLAIVVVAARNGDRGGQPLERHRLRG